MVNDILKHFKPRRYPVRDGLMPDGKPPGMRWKNLFLLLGVFVGLHVAGIVALFSASPEFGMRLVQSASIDWTLGEPVPVATPSGAVMTWTTGLEDGDHVVLVHGFGDAGAGWVRVAQNLATTHRVTILDLPGHGRSDLGSGPLTMDRLVAGLDAVLSGIDQQITLAGNSMGGWVAAEWALAHPGRVRRLVLVNSAGLPQAIDPELLMPTTREGVEAKNRIVMGSHAPWLPGLLLDGLMAMGQAPQLRPLFDHLTNEAPKLTGRLRGLQAQLRLVWGTPDAFFPYESYLPRVQAEAPKDTPTRVLAGCGHAPQYSCPKLVAHSIREP